MLLLNSITGQLTVIPANLTGMISIIAPGDFSINSGNGNSIHLNTFGGGITIYNNVVYPDNSNQISLGRVDLRWTGVYGIIGDFTGILSPQRATTATAPAYVKGAMYFDTTMNKLRIGGATTWETITST